jgi:hypothetical protein
VIQSLGRVRNIRFHEASSFSKTPILENLPTPKTNCGRWALGYLLLREGGIRRPRRVAQRSLVCRVTRAGATSENPQKAKFAEYLFHALV